MNKRLIIIIVVGAIALSFFLYYNSIHNTFIKLLTIATITAFWVGILSLIWQQKILRFAIAIFPVIFGLLFALPSRSQNIDSLRDSYIKNTIALVGTKYIWGGENSTGIDCSGLPRKALRDALLTRGITRLDGGSMRQWFEQWWFDASAIALSENYRNYTVSLPISGTIRTMNYEQMEAGDLAVTDNGVHVLVYLGSDRWIQADPDAGKVIIVNGRSDRSAWLDSPVTMYRWKVFI